MSTGIILKILSDQKFMSTNNIGKHRHLLNSLQVSFVDLILSK